ncbi:MAG TPA: SdpI family protein [Caulobacteraceae bacterium]
MTSSDSRPRRDPLDLVAGLVVVAMLALGAWLWRDGPLGPLPMHFDVHGAVDRWGDRASLAEVVAATAIGFACVYGILIWMGRALAPDAPGRRGLRATGLIMVCLAIMIAGISTAMAYGDFSAPQGSGRRLMTALLALLFLVVGALMGKAGPNPFVGMRSYWTFKSRHAWDKSNRMMGRLYFWIGAAALIAAPFLDPGTVTPALVTAILLATAASFIEGLRAWRADPERHLP